MKSAILLNILDRFAFDAQTAAFGCRAIRVDGALCMPAKSKAQQKAAGAALSAKRSETSKNSLPGASRSMVDSMSEKQLHAMAATKRRGKPDHTDKSKRR